MHTNTIAKQSLVFYLFGMVFLLMITLSACKFNEQESKPSDLVTLGHYLFFDPRLSINNTKSCGSCHEPTLYFTDAYNRTLGVYADVQLRNTPSIINSVNFTSLNWANPNIRTFQQQMLTPLFSKTHFEMGMDEKNAAQATRVLDNPIYQKLLQQLHAQKNWDIIKDAISAYCTSVVSRKSPYDALLATHDTSTWNSAQKNGMQLFFSAKLGCANCHGGLDFNTPKDTANAFANTGLYNCNGRYANADDGVFLISNKPEDIGKFRIPSLRNVEKTAPYYHDGSASNLIEVVNNYANAGRNITWGINKGDGAKHPNKNKLITGFTITENEKKALISFLYQLTDTSVLSNPLFQNPFANK
jgi:cytochrome c peroxidase